ncbi:Pterin-4-alpha-carbinolamine dehydratase [uncultured Candidatus Thioglobus sp.]|nr:Pterin-4-alpha-carbinolamine dehydratase [uncultured Candidatus Thioglobus sp.]
MALKKATDTEIQAFIAKYDAWRIKGGKLHREYIFNDFIEAFGFMTKAALVAQSSNHHPEWFNVYKKVVVDLTTHESAGITQLDFELAAKMEQLADLTQDLQ